MIKKSFIISSLLLASIIIITGCNSHSIQQDFNENFEIKKYGNGTVLMQDKQGHTEKQDKFNINYPITNVKVGPEEIKFGPEDDF